MNVAVIIAAYQAPRDWLEVCADSVRLSAMAANLTGLDLRIGVDGCDQTAAALNADGDPFWWSPVNVGPYVMRNSLIALAPADAFVVFDADDVMLPNYLTEVLRLLRVYPMVGPSRIECDEHLNRIEFKPYRHGVCAFTPDVLAKLGGYKGERLGADVDLVARAKTAGIQVVTAGACYLRRRHSASLTHAADTAKGSAAREEARRRMERQRLSARHRVYVEPVMTPLVRMPEAMSA
jgi:hypothetical protein